MGKVDPIVPAEPVVPEEPLPEEPQYVELADMTPEELLDLEDRHLHQVMESGPQQMAAHIRDARTTIRHMEEVGLPLTDEQKFTLIRRGDAIRITAKKEYTAAPDELETWDGREVPEDLRLKIEAVLEEPEPIKIER